MLSAAMAAGFFVKQEKRRVWLKIWSKVESRGPVKQNDADVDDGVVCVCVCVCVWGGGG